MPSRNRTSYAWPGSDTSEWSSKQVLTIAATLRAPTAEPRLLSTLPWCVRRSCVGYDMRGDVAPTSAVRWSLFLREGEDEKEAYGGGSGRKVRGEQARRGTVERALVRRAIASLLHDGRGRAELRCAKVEEHRQGGL